LNHDFIDNAFNDTEKTAILETEVNNPDNSEFHTEGGVDTIDRMFLLSIDEVKMYLPNKKDRIGKFTKYTKYLMSQYRFKDYSPIWWLRSPGAENYYAECIDFDGSIGGGLPTSASYPGVRPAMWLDLECIN